jgi:hypothetical protein
MVADVAGARLLFARLSIAPPKPYHRPFQSGEWGWNPRSPASKAGGLPLSYPLHQWTVGESHPDVRLATAVSRLDEQPKGGPAGGRTRSSALTRAACGRNTSRPSSCGVNIQSGKRESNPPRRAHETLLEPLQSIPQSVGPAGVEPAFHRVSDGRLAARLRPEIKAPCTGIEPVSPVRQTGCHASFITGQSSAPGGSRTHLSGMASRCLDRSATGASGTRTARMEGVEPSTPVLEAGCSPRSTPLSVSGRDRTRTCKGLRLARFPSGCHRAFWLALPLKLPRQDSNLQRSR